MEFEITAMSRITLNHEEGMTGSQHVKTDFMLEVSSNLDLNQYVGPNGLPTKYGSQAMTMAFISGLAANIHFSHQKGFRDSAEHLRYIITELEIQFIKIATIQKGTW